MPLIPGSRHGVYQIGELLGKGGMGEVFQARDTKLDRVVAIKVLPESFARDRDLLGRFEREAKTLASLNHPNIAQLYGFEESGGVLAIIMEFVPGPTLWERIKRGPVPIDEAIAIARQIAGALEVAHDSGVIHRDLKPANVKITPDGQVKLLDFGLAKGTSDDRPTGVSADSPTLTLRQTEAGVILGTAGYMAPEQVRGTQVDKRADIWAYGVVFYELLTGQRAFTGETVSDILAATLRAELDWSALPAGTPRHVRRLLEQCLQRDRKKRLRDIADAWLISSDEPVAAPTVKRGWPRLAVAGLLGAIGTAAILWMATSRSGLGGPADLALRRFSVSLGSDVNLTLGPGPSAILSRDGTRLAYVSGRRDAGVRLYTRRLDQAEPRVMAGTDGAMDPFFSPDGLWIGFFADGKMKKVSVEGGNAVTLAETGPGGPGSASWGDDGQILATLSGALVRVPESGGTPQPVTTLATGEVQHRWPQLLPGSKSALFTSNLTAYANEGAVEAVVLATGQRKVLHRKGSFGRYIESGAKAGYLTWVTAGTVYAAPFDSDRLELTGGPRPVIENVAFGDPRGGAQIDFAADGAAVFVPTRADSLNTIQWLDASGNLKPLLAKPAYYSYPVFSPDGHRLAYLLTSGGNNDLWILDLDRDVSRRITFSAESEYVFAWTPDQQWIIYSVGKQLKMVRTDGSGEPLTVYESASKSGVYLHAISADGKHLAFCEQGVATGNDLWTATLAGTPDQPKVVDAQPFEATRFYEIFASFSPDGRWLAYGSNESGLGEVYVRPFPAGSGKFQVSNGKGMMPVFAAKGRELYYRNAEDRINVVEYQPSAGSISFAKTRVWSQHQLSPGGSLRDYSLSPDGKRFAVVVREEGAELRRNNEVVFLENFTAELRRIMAK